MAKHIVLHTGKPVCNEAKALAEEQAIHDAATLAKVNREVEDIEAAEEALEEAESVAKEACGFESPEIESSIDGNVVFRIPGNGGTKKVTDGDGSVDVVMPVTFPKLEEEVHVKYTSEDVPPPSHPRAVKINTVI